jgi:hypothetical protein
VNRGGGDGAQPWRRCSGMAAHRRWTGGWAGAQGKQDGSVKHLGEGGSSRGSSFLRQAEAAAERSTAMLMLR